MRKKLFAFRYRITVRNEINGHKVTSFRISRASLTMGILAIAAALCVVTFFLIATTPLKQFLPGYLNVSARKQIVTNALRLDSLQQVALVQKQYIANFQNVMSGEIPLDSINAVDSLAQYQQDTLMDKSYLETQFQKEYEAREKYNLTTITAKVKGNELLFMPPLRGLMMKPDLKQEKALGVWITADKKEPIMATLGGTVIIAESLKGGFFLISIQHPQGFVSSYHAQGTMLVKQGDKVTTGQVLAHFTDGDILHFSMWKQGEAINPEHIIVF